MHKDIYKTMADVEEKHWWFRSRTKIVEKFIKKMNRTNMRILDMGCASGKNFEMLSKYGEIIGFEPEEFSIEIAKTKNIAKEIIQGFMPQDENKINGQFDLIILTDVLEHVEKDVETLAVLNRLLKPEGKLIITVPAVMWLWSHHDETHFHFRRYTHKELKEKMISQGLNVEYSSYFNFFLFPIVAGVRTFKKSIPFLRNTNDLTKEPYRIVNALLEFIFSSERHFLGWLRFPIGVSVLAIASKKNNG